MARVAFPRMSAFRVLASQPVCPASAGWPDRPSPDMLASRRRLAGLRKDCGRLVRLSYRSPANHRVSTSSANGAKSVIISIGRTTLRDFEPADRAAFVAYQMDPRYRRLYDLDENPDRASALFSLFLGWQSEVPRRNFQLGVFDAANDRLCGCAGLRQRPDDPETAVLGIELAPSDWGRYRVALDVTAGLVEHGFSKLGLRTIVGDTASGNKRVEKMARWFGARITDQREGPAWMRDRGWQEVDWTIRREEWQRSDKRRQTLLRLAPAE